MTFKNLFMPTKILRILIIPIMLLLLWSSCKKEVTEQPGPKTTDTATVAPKAGFSYTYTTANKQTLQFTDTSKHAKKWLWIFGDGKTDTTQNPKHIYTVEPGTLLTVQLIVSNVSTKKDTIEVKGIIIGQVIPRANIMSADVPFRTFLFTQAGGGIGTVVPFSAPSATPLKYAWDFGDMTTTLDTSTMPTPTYTYSKTGKYTVILKVTSITGDEATYTKEVMVNVYNGEMNVSTFDAYPNQDVSGKGGIFDLLTRVLPAMPVSQSITVAPLQGSSFWKFDASNSSGFPLLLMKTNGRNLRLFKDNGGSGDLLASFSPNASILWNTADGQTKGNLLNGDGNQQIKIKADSGPSEVVFYCQLVKVLE